MPEHKLRCTEPHLEPGGGGLNVARAIEILGGEATALWTCGGPNGTLLRGLLDRGGLRHVPIPIQAMTRDNLAVYERASGMQYRFGMPGAPLTEEELERAYRTIAELSPPPAYLVLSGSLPPGVPAGFYADTIRRIPDQTRVIVDTSGPPLREAMEVGAYLVKPNLRELEQAAGRRFESDADIVKAARHCADSGRATVVVVSLGAGGALLVTCDQSVQIRSPTVPIRSKVGAGDSMVAGMTLGLSRGQSLADAARLGVAAGASAVMTAGSALCTREETERLYAQMKAEAAAS
jgi:6-phosphofructokinase 2